MKIIDNQNNFYCNSLYSKNHIYTLNQIKELTNEAMEEYNTDNLINKIYLFGSYARNSANAESDIDLFIDMDDENVGLQFFGLYVLFEELFNKSIDIVLEGSENMSENLKKNIEKDKVLIYEK